MTSQAITLMTALLFAHFLGDFTSLSTPRMLEAKAGRGAVSLIVLHAAVHTLLVAAAVLLVVGATTAILVAAAIEFVTHFLIDHGRARLAVAKPGLQNADRKPFWTVLGADQLLHALVLVLITATVL